MDSSQIISASEFKAKCLDILDRINRRELERVRITKRGRVVAVLVPPDQKVDGVERLYGWAKGSVIIPPGFDLTEPVLDVPFEAAEGKLPE